MDNNPKCTTVSDGLETLSDTGRWSVFDDAQAPLQHDAAMNAVVINLCRKQAHWPDRRPDGQAHPGAPWADRLDRCFDAPDTSGNGSRAVSMMAIRALPFPALDMFVPSFSHRKDAGAAR